MSAPETIPRHKTAIRRSGLSRPLRIAVDAGMVSPEASVLDYGCGRGHDIQHLSQLGVRAEGWDPVHRPDGRRRPADVVNLGYVVNVIEDPGERASALASAWELTQRLLIVSARLGSEVQLGDYEDFNDGCITGLDTFQKFYTQGELRAWIDQTIETRSVAAAPGVFFVFRDEALKQSYLSARYRRRRAAPKLRKSDVLFEEHRDLLEPLVGFVTDRGRLPAEQELSETEAIETVLGSLRRAFSVVRRVTGRDQWDQIRKQRQDELLVYLGLMRFTGRPRFGELPADLRLDVRAFFSTYRNACQLADELLFTAGDMDMVSTAIRSARVGKCTGNALYVHVDALPHLEPILQMYEGCARSYVGAVNGANVVKLHRQEPKVSYLCYPRFDAEPHPSLLGALVVPLQTLDVHYYDYRDSGNPPVLHRKEQFVPEDYPHRAKFERLTRQEERWGLFDDPRSIGRRDGWLRALAAGSVQLRGHRVVRKKGNFRQPE